MERLEIDLSLVVLVASLVHAGWLTGCLATRRYGLATSSILTASMLSVLLGLAAGVSWAATGNSSGPRFDLLAVPCALTTWFALRFGGSMWFRASVRPASWPVYAGAHLLLFAAAGWQFQSSTAAHSDSLEAEPQFLYPMVVVDDVVLVTNQGRVFTVFHFDPRETPYDDKLQSTYVDAQWQQPAITNGGRRQNSLHATLIRLSRVQVAPADGIANCHGWALAGGCVAVNEATVAAILQDNGYELVAEPQQGDVIVYRDEAGAIVHSGRVRRVHSSEEVWIESKWGSGARYIHLPLDQCYSRTMEYYRPTRPHDEPQLVQTPATKGPSILSLRGVPAANSG